MKKKLSLDNLKVESFVTAAEETVGGLVPKPLDDGTIEYCHCPTMICTPSADMQPTICCL